MPCIRGGPRTPIRVYSPVVRLLFDQNLSHRLADALADIYPGALHVRDIDMESVDDLSVWSYAEEHDLIIVSKDSDFRQFSFTYGHPPKVVWIRRGNCSTVEVESLLRDHCDGLYAFERDDFASFLALM